MIKADNSCMKYVTNFDRISLYNWTTITVFITVFIYKLFLRVLTPYEAKSLVAMLHSRDPLLLERALVTVSNSAAFTANQVRYCDTMYAVQSERTGSILLNVQGDSGDLTPGTGLMILCR